MRRAVPRRESLSSSWIVLAIAMGLAWLFLAARPADDPYITYRYARNLVDGYGFVFNPGGPSVDGFSSPIWLLLSTAADATGASVAPVMSLIGGVLGVVGVMLT